MGTRRKFSWPGWGTWTLVVLLVVYPLAYPVSIALLTQVNYGMIILSKDHSAIPYGVPIWCHCIVWSTFEPVELLLGYTPEWFQSAFNGYFDWRMNRGLQLEDLPSLGASWCGIWDSETPWFVSP